MQKGLCGGLSVSYNDKKHRIHEWEVSPVSKTKNKNKPPVCPYCGRSAVLRAAAYIYPEHTLNANQKYYVCAGYPACNSYVGVHDGSLRPKGTMANSELRNRRILAHKTFDEIWKRGILSRKEAYRWLRDITGLTEAQAHIACFSEYRCDQLIAAAQQVLDNYPKRKEAAYYAGHERAGMRSCE